MTTEIFTTGFPRSGNTWLWHTLSDLFCAPMAEKEGWEQKTQFAASIKPGYVIRKTHMRVHEYKAVKNDTCKIVLTWRDPRDMVVSRMYYWNRGSLDAAIDSLNPNYREFMFPWLENPPDFTVTYERMHREPLPMLCDLYRTLTKQEPDTEHVSAVIERQTFQNTIHLVDRHAQRKGIVGDWKNHFSREQAYRFEKEYGDILRILGYETDSSWCDLVD